MRSPCQIRYCSHFATRQNKNSLRERDVMIWKNVTISKADELLITKPELPPARGTVASVGGTVACIHAILASMVLFEWRGIYFTSFVSGLHTVRMD